MINNRDAINSETADRARRHEHRIAELEMRVAALDGMSTETLLDATETGDEP
jgi:hypothetical protein